MNKPNRMKVYKAIQKIQAANEELNAIAKELRNDWEGRSDRWKLSEAGIKEEGYIYHLEYFCKDNLFAIRESPFSKRR